MFGREREFWSDLLRSPSFPLRLQALRVIRQMGRDGARMLLKQTQELPLWPLAWALQGCATPAQLRRGKPFTPQRLALTLQRRGPRPRSKQRPYPLELVVERLQLADNAHLRLSWMMILLEQHSEAAASRLLDLLLVDTPEELAGLIAWALGQLGRNVLFGVQETFRNSPPAVQSWLCQVCWYLGPQAQGSESFLATAPGPWALAALHALEVAGSRALIQRREAPVWIDKFSLGSLAALVQSEQPQDRLYAARALAGWGPALPRVARFLETLCLDPSHELRDAAWRGLGQLGGVTSIQALRAGLQSGDQEVRRAALECFQANYGEQPLEVLRRNAQDPQLSMVAALAVAAQGVERKNLSEALDTALHLQGMPLLSLLDVLALSGAPEHDDWDLAPLLQAGQIDARLAACRLLLAWGDPRHQVLPLVDDPDTRLSHFVTEHLLDHGNVDDLLRLLEEGPRLVRRLAAVESKSTLSRLRRLSDGLGLSPLLSRLQDLLEHHDPEVSRAAQRLLRGQDLNTMSWGQLDAADPELQSSVTSLIRRSGTFPDSLLAAMMEGLYLRPATLELVSDMFASERTATLLWSMFTRAPRLHRAFFLEPLLRLDEGWKVLLELVGHHQPDVSEDAVPLLLKWLDRRDCEGLQDPSLLRLPPSASAQGLLAVGLAEALLGRHQPLESRWFEWARVLARHPDYRAAGTAIEALGRYALRSEGDERRLALAGLMRACNHSQRSVRLLSLQQIRQLNLSDEERFSVAAHFRALGLDPEPLVQVHRWHWLAQYDSLTSYEREQALLLLDESEDQEVRQELTLLTGSDSQSLAAGRL